MPSNQTANYALSQWERSDKVLMEDFNADNAKIDTALKSLAGLISGHTTTLSKKGNCQIYTRSYIGTGTYGEDNPIQYTFPEPPVLVFIMDETAGFLPLVRGKTISIYPSYGYNTVRITWNGNSVSWYAGEQKSHMNIKGEEYILVALCSKS